MPILFKPEFVEKILSGEKTVTRRRWKSARVKVGNVYQARTTLFGEPFAWLRIISLTQETCPLASVEMTEWDVPEARLEGFASWTELREWWEAHYGNVAWAEPCYRVEFEVVEKPADQTTKAR